MEFQKINYNFSLALDLAHKALKLDEVPVGAIITNKYGDVIGEGHNTKEADQNPCMHAEIISIQNAAKKIGNWRLEDCDIYVTLEPCIMCMGALSQARIRNIYFAAYDPKGGAISLGKNIHDDQRLNHKMNVFGGFKHIECSKIISNFFKKKRLNYKK